MKKFKFRYQSVLKMREDREFSLKTELAALLSDLARLHSSCQEAQASQQRYQEHFRENTRAGISSYRLRQYENGIKYYVHSILKFHAEIERKNAEIAEVRLLLTEAMKERKVMEKLKEKEKQSYYEEMNKAEHKAVEEIVNGRRKYGGK